MSGSTAVKAHMYEVRYRYLDDDGQYAIRDGLRLVAPSLLGAVAQVLTFAPSEGHPDAELLSVVQGAAV